MEVRSRRGVPCPHDGTREWRGVNEQIALEAASTPTRVVNATTPVRCGDRTAAHCRGRMNLLSCTCAQAPGSTESSPVDRSPALHPCAHASAAPFPLHIRSRHARSPRIWAAFFRCAILAASTAQPATERGAPRAIQPASRQHLGQWSSMAAHASFQRVSAAPWRSFSIEQVNIQQLHQAQWVQFQLDRREFRAIGISSSADWIAWTTVPFIQPVSSQLAAFRPSVGTSRGQTGNSAIRPIGAISQSYLGAHHRPCIRPHVRIATPPCRHAKLLVAHQRPLPFRGLEPQTITKIRQDSPRLIKTRQDSPRLAKICKRKPEP